MDLHEYAQYDGLGLAELVRSKAVTAREVCSLALEAISQVNPQLNAVLEVFPDRLPKQEETPSGPFAGVPFLIKDLPIERGVLAEMGSRLAKGFKADHDAELMMRFRRAGLVTLGRTATSEFALAALTRSVHSGVTRNPWNLERSTAGSSGGSAAAVAAGVVPLAQGSDGGGSIRNPASFCGLVGLKPTRGRVSLGPDDGDAYSGMVTSFALTRSVRDCAALLDAVAGPAVGDPFEIPQPEQPFLDEVSADAGQLRIGFTTRAWSGLPVDGEIVEAVERTVALCGDLGHTVEEDSPSFDYEPFLKAQIDLWCAHVAASINFVARAVGHAPTPKTLQTTTWATYRAGKEMTATRFLAAEAVYNDMTRRVARFFVDRDVLVTPTNTVLPLPLDRHDINAPGATVRDLFDHLAPIETFTALFNATGQPALSLPLQWSRGGLPIGIHLVGRFGDEARLFRLAGALERAQPWAGRRPPVHVAAGIRA